MESSQVQVLDSVVVATIIVSIVVKYGNHENVCNNSKSSRWCLLQQWFLVQAPFLLRDDNDVDIFVEWSCVFNLSSFLKSFNLLVF